MCRRSPNARLSEGRLEPRPHPRRATAPRVDTLTGAGLADVLTGAEVVVDVSNSPSFAGEPVMAFFTTSTGNLLPAETAAGVRHHVALSVVGADRMPDSGCMRAKVGQESLIEQSGLPYTILRATQFFEFLATMADAATSEGTVVAAAAALQPVAAADVRQPWLTSPSLPRATAGRRSRGPSGAR